MVNIRPDNILTNILALKLFKIHASDRKQFFILKALGYIASSKADALLYISTTVGQSQI